MRRIEKVMPVLPVPLVSRALLAGISTRDAVEAEVAANLADLAKRGVTLPRRDATKITDDALENLRRRKLVRESDGTYALEPASEDTLAFYAASIAHHFDAAAAKTR